MKRRNPETALADFDDLTVDTEDGPGPDEFQPWYQQFLRLDEKKRRVILKRSMDQLAEANPETYEFIRKMNCELVGICPEISYALCSEAEGDIKATFVHGFALPTLLFWCKKGKFGFFVNPNLDYNDTVLNKQRGNSKERLHGFTG